MNTMNMPGFTAQASLYKRRGRYGMIASGDAALAKQAVAPALIIDTIGRAARCVAACTACALAGGGPDCWDCRICFIILTSVSAR